MNGFYSIWSEPSLYYNKNGIYKMEDYELLTFVLSVCVWKKYNGKALLFADIFAIEYIKNCGLGELFDGGIYELNVDPGINSDVFWAAGKLTALKMAPINTAMIDLDLIVWKNLDSFVAKGDITAIHREEIRSEIYPDYSFFNMKSEYVLPVYFDSEVLPVNTAFLYIADYDFKNLFADTAIDFMVNCIEERENLKHMVFAEQRLLPIMARSYDKTINTMFDYAGNVGNQSYFTHVWGHKNVLKYNYDERVKFCKRVMDRLNKEFGDVYAICKNMEELSIYAEV